MKTIVYIFLMLFILFDVYLVVKTTEFAFCAFWRHLAPFVPSSRALRRAVSGRTPVRVIDVPGGGWVKFKGKKYPHKLFVYEF